MPDATSHHAALLAKLSDNEDQWLLFGALRVVLELHRPAPGPFALTSGEGVWLCYGCSHLGWSKPVTVVGWFDCATIKAVAGALGVDLNG